MAKPSKPSKPPMGPPLNMSKFSKLHKEVADESVEDDPAIDQTKEIINSDDPQKTRKEINDRNRNFGKSVERNVAKLLDGDRVPSSGAIKQSNLDLTGDVKVSDANGRPLLKLECKGTSKITPSGDKTFTLKKSVLDQATREAKDAHVLGAVWVHWQHSTYATDDYAIISSEHFVQLIEWAKIGKAVEEHGKWPVD